MAEKGQRALFLDAAEKEKGELICQVKSKDARIDDLLQKTKVMAAEMHNMEVVILDLKQHSQAALAYEQKKSDQQIASLVQKSKFEEKNSVAVASQNEQLRRQIAQMTQAIDRFKARERELDARCRELEVANIKLTNDLSGLHAKNCAPNQPFPGSPHLKMQTYAFNGKDPIRGRSISPRGFN